MISDVTRFLLQRPVGFIIVDVRADTGKVIFARSCSGEFAADLAFDSPLVQETIEQGIKGVGPGIGDDDQ